MDVRLKLLLQGGHVWEFRCDQDDPIVAGLVSALPGADAGANLPPDGLVQVETRTGERLFLTRSSLVSVEIVTVPEALPVRHVKSHAPFSVSLPVGMSGPAPFVAAQDALPNHVHRSLLEHAVARSQIALPTECSEGAALDLGLGGLTQQVALGLRSKAEKCRSTFGIADALETHAQFRLFAVGDKQAVPLIAEKDTVLSLVYVFYKQPKMFTGGGVRLFDTEPEERERRVSFRDLELENNSLLMFPGYVVSAALPVRCTNREMSDALFVVHGTLRRTDR